MSTIKQFAESRSNVEERQRSLRAVKSRASWTSSLANAQAMLATSAALRRRQRCLEGEEPICLQKLISFLLLGPDGSNMICLQYCCHSYKAEIGILQIHEKIIIFTFIRAETNLSVVTFQKSPKTQHSSKACAAGQDGALNNVSTATEHKFAAGKKTTKKTPQHQGIQTNGLGRYHATCSVPLAS